MKVSCFFCHMLFFFLLRVFSINEMINYTTYRDYVFQHEIDLIPVSINLILDHIYSDPLLIFILF